MAFAVKLIEALLSLLALLPLSFCRSGGKCLGRALQAFDKKHKNIVRENLRFSFPEKDALWINDAANACFAHFGMVLGEIPFLAKAPLSKLAVYTRLHGAERLRRHQGGLVLTGHIGNWEWCNLALALIDCRGLVLARPLDNKALDIVVRRWRERHGQTVVANDVSARRLLRKIKSGVLLGALMDQNVDWMEGEWVDFFGRPACTNTGMAAMALLSGGPVYTLYCLRGDDGIFDVHIGEALPLARSGDRRRDIWQNTQNFTAFLEEVIRSKPEQWLWLHQRWKTKNYCPWPRAE
jgi:KDO2-lipid IV(A) lauroyltransferase